MGRGMTDGNTALADFQHNLQVDAANATIWQAIETLLRRRTLALQESLCTRKTPGRINRPRPLTCGRKSGQSASGHLPCQLFGTGASQTRVVLPSRCRLHLVSGMAIDIIPSFVRRSREFAGAFAQSHPPARKMILMMGMGWQISQHWRLDDQSLLQRRLSNMSTVERHHCRLLVLKLRLRVEN